MKYLYYKAKVKGIAGISDRRACIAVLLAEAKLTNRVPILPKMMLCKNHQTLIKKDMIYTECLICHCNPKPDEWSAQVQGVCFDCG